MKLTVNQKEREFPDSINLDQVLQLLSLPTTQGLALAVNQQVVHRSDWGSHVLNQGDSILLLQAVQGG